MPIELMLPSRAAWALQGGEKKLSLRAGLPGARVYDLVASSLRDAKARGMSAEDRLYLALPSSWLVNSPAVSVVLRRWALPPHRDTCVALLELLDDDGRTELTEAEESAMTLAITSLGSEPYVTEALSKVMALLAPDRVPLMPAPARTFVLGEGGDLPVAFARMVGWFERTVAANRAALEAIAHAHTEVTLSAGGVVDRLLWFDSEGHRHFPPLT